MRRGTGERLHLTPRRNIVLAAPSRRAGRAASTRRRASLGCVLGHVSFHPLRRVVVASIDLNAGAENAAAR